MSHFAKIDKDNIVTEVIVADQDFINSGAVGDSFSWIQTSYNNNFRKQLAGVGYTYDKANDVFISPKPFPSWTLDSNYDWQPANEPGAISSGGAMLRGANGSTVQEWVHGSRATVSPSHTTMYSWYKLVSPGGYSNAGTPGVWEIHCHIAGGHASSAILQKFTLVQSNNHAHIADHGGANHSLCYRFCNIDPGGGAYGVSLTVNCYYLSTGAGNNGATFFFKCTHAAREPHFTFYAKYIGGTGAGIGNYEQSLSFLGTQSNNNHQPEHKTEIPITVTH